MLTLYTRRDCHLCTAAVQLLRVLSSRLTVPLTLADIDHPGTPALLRAHYDTAVPVLHLDGRELARGRIDAAEVEGAIALARTVVVVLSKFPEPGKVKTRLTVGEGALTPAEAAAVHRVSLLHLLRRLADLHPHRLVLCHDPPDAAPPFTELFKAAGVTGTAAVDLLPQSSGDLGDRIASAYESLSDSEHGVLFLGVDSPDVPASHLREAARAMTSGPGTLGPTPDGGYWCIGLGGNLPVRNLLNGIPWSSGREYAATLERFASKGYSLPPCPAWDDVDHPPDLRQLMDRLSRSTSLLDRGLFADLQGALGGRTP
jgi:glycosyltransferase A (GT-A) superfamily protein (DUF2064 family)